MTFRVYAGVSGSRTQSWHSDCGTAGTPMAIDIGASAGSTVRFSIHNDGSNPLSFRYRVDCSSFPTGTPSSVMVEVDTGADEYLFRYTHLNVASDIPSAGGSWSSWTVVLAGQTRGKILGTLSSASAKAGIPGYSNGDCGQAGGTTDVGGLCSSGPHLHQGASNGNYDGCLSARDDRTCGYTRGIEPERGSIPQQVSSATVVYSA